MMSEVTTYPTRLSGSEIRGLMRKHRITIRELARRTGITMKRIRQVRERGIDQAAAVRDWCEAIAGSSAGEKAESSISAAVPQDGSAFR